ncbi:hypothetical protein, partial [Paenirhodobacter ferrireducens]|uniref:hypothetical protein n=1 Tax=Paenirhodobacter ferrireducens TaxID=1215032 RepID=UPI0019CF5F70
WSSPFSFGLSRHGLTSRQFIFFTIHFTSGEEEFLAMQIVPLFRAVFPAPQPPKPQFRAKTRPEHTLTQPEDT